MLPQPANSRKWRQSEPPSAPIAPPLLALCRWRAATIVGAVATASRIIVELPGKEIGSLRGVPVLKHDDSRPGGLRIVSSDDRLMPRPTSGPLRA
jgi:hypothetical protein